MPTKARASVLGTGLHGHTSPRSALLVKAMLARRVKKRRITRDHSRVVAKYRRVYAWVLADAVRYSSTISCGHPPGAVIWCALMCEEAAVLLSNEGTETRCACLHNSDGVVLSKLLSISPWKICLLPA